MISGEILMKKIELTKGKVALVDDEDYDWLNKHSWSLEHEHSIKSRTVYYARGFVGGKTVQMHRLIMNFPKGRVVDHINGDGLDNRRCNLRIITTRQNQQNRKTKTSSKYPGVRYHKKHQKYYSGIKVKGKYIYLGGHDSEIEAFEAYKKAVHELTGEKLICEL
ncbi:MAG: HNH endonuclease [Methanobacterium sp.]